MIRAYVRQHHVGLIALLLVLLSGSSAYAAATIGAGDIKKNAVRAKHIKDGVVGGADVNEASLDVSRVVNRARGSTLQTLTTTPSNYPLSQGATWTQAGNETVNEYVGVMAFTYNGCFPDNINLNFKVDGQTIDEQTVSASDISPFRFDSEFADEALFEPGTSTSRTFTVEALATDCSGGGGPIQIQNIAVNLIGLR